MGQQALTLQVKNYRRFVATDVIAFEPGLTIISGLNGAGKSTLIEAFIYALFGPGSKRGQGIIDIRTDSFNEQVCVECKLWIDEQEIHIIRFGNAAELRINGVLQVERGAASGKSVSARIIALLGGLTREQFERTYIALQGDTAGLVTEKANERRQIIEKILQLEVLTKAVELQANLCESAKGSIISLGNLICDELSLDTRIRGYIQSFQKARVIHSKSQYTQQLLKSIGQVITERQRGYQEVERSVSQAQAKISDLEKQYQEHEMMVKRVHQAYIQQEENQKKYNEYQGRIASIDGKIEQSKLDAIKDQYIIEQTGRYSDASAIYHRLIGEIKKYEIQLERIPLIRNCYNTFVQAQMHLYELDSKLGDFGTVDEELQQAKKCTDQAKLYLEMLRSNDPTRADYEEWQRQSSEINLETKQNREALELLTGSANDARCPTCNQLFLEHAPEHRIQHLHAWFKTLPHVQTELQRRKQVIDEKRKQWDQEQQKAESTYHQFQDHFIAIEKKVSTRDTLRTQRVSAHNNYLESQKAWLTLKEEVPDAQEETILNNRLDDLKNRASELKEQADVYAQLLYIQQRLIEKQQEQNKLAHEKQALLEQQSVLTYTPEDFQAAKDALIKISEEGAQVQSHLHEAELALKEAEFIAQQAQNDIEASQAHYYRFSTYVQACFREERLHEHLEEFKKHFFEANTEEVMRRTTELLMHAITDQSILGIKFDRDELQYLDARYSAYSINRLSGGEKALVGLCLRIALAEQAQTITRTGHVKFLVLDEVLSSLDEERCEAVKRIFDDVLQRGIFEHIIMITHLDTIKQSWHAHGLVVQKLDGKMSTVISISSGEVPMDLTEEIEV